MKKVTKVALLLSLMPMTFVTAQVTLTPVVKHATKKTATEAKPLRVDPVDVQSVQTPKPFMSERFIPDEVRKETGTEVKKAQKWAGQSVVTTDVSTTIPSEEPVSIEKVAPVKLMVPEIGFNEDPVIYAIEYYEPSWSTGLTNDTPNLRKIDLKTGTSTIVDNGIHWFGRSQAVKIGNKYDTWVLTSAGYAYHYNIDLDDYDATFVDWSYDYPQSPAICYEPTSDKTYVCYVDGNAYSWGTYNAQSGTITKLADLGATPLMALSANADGTLYGVDATGNFGTVNKADGKMTVISKNTNLANGTFTIGCIDTATHKFYYAPVVGSVSKLYAIDLETGAAEFVTDLADNIIYYGGWLPRVAGAAGDPAMVDGLALNMEDVCGTSGFVTFTLPTTLLDGTEIPSNERVDYTVLINGEEVYNEWNSPGRTEMAPFDITSLPGSPQSGTFTFSVIAEYNGAKSQPAILKQFIGLDEISSISNARVAIEDGNFVITWDGPVSKNGGNIDLVDRVSYDITLYPNDKSVVYNLDGTHTSYTYPIGDLKNGEYYFGISPWIVSANVESAMREEVLTNVVTLGSYQVPFSSNFGTSGPATFTIVDNNHDDYSWIQQADYAVCSYNDDQVTPMDDWMIVGPIELKANTAFELTLNAGCNGYDETIEVYLGTNNKVDAMNRRIIDPTLVNTGRKTINTQFYVAEGGDYYIGFHGCSEPDQYFAYLFDFTLTETGTGEMPGQATDIEATRKLVNDYNLYADLSFKAPAVTFDNNVLTEITQLVVKMNDEELGSYDDVIPGQQIEINDIAITKPGNQTFTILATNSVGTSTTTITTFIGWRAPKTPEYMLAVQGVEDNSMDISWERITTDINGDAITPNMWYNPNIIYADTHQRGFVITPSSSYHHEPVLINNGGIDDNVDLQQPVMYYVTGYYYTTSTPFSGPSYHTQAAVFSNWAPVGPAYTLPYVESFKNGYASSIFLSNDDEEDFWYLTDEADSVVPYDSDGGMLAYEPKEEGKGAYLHSGLVDLREAEHPVMRFFYYAVPQSTDKFKIEIDVYNQFETVAEISLGQTETEGWTRAEIDLEKFIGNKIRYRLTSEGGNTLNTILLDNICFAENKFASLTVEAPATANVGDEVKVDITVINSSADTMSAYQVELTANGNIVETFEGSNLAVGEQKTFTATLTAAVTHGDAINFVATVSKEGETPVTAEFVTVVINNDYPVPTNLTAIQNVDTKAVELTWDAPELEMPAAEVVTETAESFPSFSQGSETIDTWNGWTAYDGDKGRTAVETIDVIPFPGTTSNQTLSWIVYDSNEIETWWDTDYVAHSGTKMFLASYSSKKNDDWLISPELSGNQQTVTFFAKAIVGHYGDEEYEVWYSETDKNVESFTKLGETREIGDQWTQDAVELPEGARYFAIRYVSDDVFGMMVDDITFEKKAEQGTPLELVGYNVYRNLEGINETPVETTTHTDMFFTRATEMETTYHVTAVYEAGESNLSEPAVINVTTGVDGVTSDGKVTFSIDGQTLVITGATGLQINVYSADGKIIATQAGEAVNRINLVAGIYVATAGEYKAKVLVK